MIEKLGKIRDLLHTAPMEPRQRKACQLLDEVIEEARSAIARAEAHGQRNNAEQVRGK